MASFAEDRYWFNPNAVPGLDLLASGAFKEGLGEEEIATTVAMRALRAADELEYQLHLLEQGE